jgi:hypothetical protein
MANELPESNGDAPEPVKDDSGLNPAWLAVGIAIGVALGVALDNLAVGIVIGGGLGLALNAVMAQRSKEA